jgi:hypothetical protein
MKGNGVLVAECAIFQERVDQNIKNLTILSSEERMGRLSSACNAFSSSWKAELLYDTTTAYILTVDQLAGRGTSEIFTLHELLELNRK